MYDRTVDSAPPIVGRLVETLRVIANENRLGILALLADGRQRTVNEVAVAMGIAQSTASEHLAALKRHARLLTSERVGKEVRYAIHRRELLALADELSGFLRDCC